MIKSRRPLHLDRTVVRLLQLELANVRGGTDTHDVRPRTTTCPFYTSCDFCNTTKQSC